MSDWSRQMLENNGRMLVNAYEKLGPETASYLRLPGSFWLYDENLNNIYSKHDKHGKPDYPPPGKPSPAGSVNQDFPAASPISEKPDDSQPPQQQPPPINQSMRGLFKSLPSMPGGSPWQKFETLFKEKQSEIKDLAARLLANKKTDSEMVGGETILGAAIESDSGKSYAVICHLPDPGPIRARIFLFRFIENLPVFLLITGFLCFMLARYIIRPLIELRTASKSFASGELQTRISGRTLKRFDEIGDLACDFNEMAEKIEKLISAQRRLFSDISHELRSPLARLQVSLELLQRKSPEADQPMVTRIGREISRMNSLIEELLQFSKLENNDINAQPEKISLKETLAHLCNDTNFEGKNRNCTVKIMATDDIEISGMPQLIERAIENILRNALKHSPENSEIRVELLRHEKIATINIIDRGPGIPETEILKVFAPFYCLSEDRNPQKGGIGLGLAIAQRAIMLHKGQITLKNNPEGGLTATISLPIVS
ncbi:MAG TPA: HAMP domain-containing sensor histidine kinase [Candidatus Rifleibacterium sp.]|nr:HAMP domain-containing sensor histidine kinase [Candidatus Rifleibacterium sp.]HPT45467.1 HAMP domain-containing sensor histidine kinase [Candidatus Rifleibacterium sp.]